jgi:hypothetical protein
MSPDSDACSKAITTKLFLQNFKIGSLCILLSDVQYDGLYCVLFSLILFAGEWGSRKNRLIAPPSVHFARNIHVCWCFRNRGGGGEKQIYWLKAAHNGKD